MSSLSREKTFRKDKQCAGKQNSSKYFPIRVRYEKDAATVYYVAEDKENEVKHLVTYFILSYAFGKIQMSQRQ